MKNQEKNHILISVLLKLYTVLGANTRGLVVVFVDWPDNQHQEDRGNVGQQQARSPSLVYLNIQSVTSSPKNQFVKQLVSGFGKPLFSKNIFAVCPNL